MGAVLFQLGNQRADDGGVIDDAFLRHLERGDAADMRLDFSHLFGGKFLKAVQPIGRAAFEELFHAV